MYIITGITRMNGDRICLSFYDTEKGYYLRPKRNGNYLTRSDLGSLRVYDVINCEVDEDVHIRNPHVEDCHLMGNIEFVRHLSGTEIDELLEDLAYESAIELYGVDARGENILFQEGTKWVVEPDTGELALGTVKVQSYQIYIDKFDKLKIDFTDIDGTFYEWVPIVSLEITNNPSNYTERYEGEAYIRLSLATPHQTPSWNRELCTLQCSSVRKI